MPNVIVLYAVVFAALYTGLYALYSNIAGIPPRSAVKTIRAAGTVRRKTFSQLVLTPMTKTLSRFMRISLYKRQKLNADLKRTGIDMTPEEYMASAWSVSILIGLLAIPCWIFGIALSAVGLIAIAVVMYFHQAQRVERALDDRDERINAEMPHFVRAMTAGIVSRLPMADSAESYLEAKPNSAMRQEMLQLIPALRLNDQRKALLSFEASIGLPLMRSVIPLLIAAAEGTCDNGQLIVLANQMDALAEENLQRTLMKRPGKIKKVSVLIMVFSLLMMIAPLVAQIVDGFAVAFG